MDNNWPFMLQFETKFKGSSHGSKYPKYVHSMFENRVSSAITKIQIVHSDMQ